MVTRKRLYKLILSYGYQPRKARFLIECAQRSTHPSYASWYRSMRPAFAFHRTEIAAKKVILGIRKATVTMLSITPEGLEVQAKIEQGGGGDE